MTRRGRIGGAWAVVAIACGGCGDAARRDELFEPVSGTRLKLERYRYEDGTEQTAGRAFYDVQLHTRCTPQRWADDVVRCVPVADDAVYRDAACTELVGRGRTIARPSHFIGYDWRGGTARPARLHRAGPPTTALAQYYEQTDGACRGPFAAPEDLPSYEIGAEIAGAELVPIHDGELGDARLALRIRETDDGARVAIGLRDRELDVACTPALRPDAGGVCEPTEFATASYFGDPACTAPVLAVAPDAPVPAIARVAEPSGCASFFSVGAEISPPLYRRDGEACIRTTLPAPHRLFPVAAPLDLAPVHRTVEALPERRLHRIILVDGELRFADDRLFDTATRAECVRHAFGDVTRCIPATVVPATAVFAPGCAAAVRVAETPQPSCDRIAFATAVTDAGLDIHAIGDRYAGAVFRLDGAACLPYAVTPGTVLRALGPPIALEAFAAAVAFGER